MLFMIDQYWCIIANACGIYICELNEFYVTSFRLVIWLYKCDIGALSVGIFSRTMMPTLHCAVSRPVWHII